MRVQAIAPALRGSAASEIFSPRGQYQGSGFQARLAEGRDREAAKAIRQWAAAEQASPGFFHVMTGSNLTATDRLMKAAGAQCLGGSYVV